ncbi:MAG: GspH/FimT family pseudopilin [Pseudomonadota bacterium]
MSADTRGFTLLELLVVLVVIGLLAVVAPPYVQGALSRMEAERASDAVAAAMAEARGIAMERNRVVRVSVDTGGGGIDVEGGRWRKLPDEVTLSLSPPPRDGRWVIVFHPDGGSSGGRVLVSAQGRAWALVVESLTGRVRVSHAG